MRYIPEDMSSPPDTHGSVRRRSRKGPGSRPRQTSEFKTSPSKTMLTTGLPSNAPQYSNGNVAEGCNDHCVPVHLDSGHDNEAFSSSGEEETSLIQHLLPGSTRSTGGEAANEDIVRVELVLTAREGPWTLATQVFMPYLIAGIGMVMAGIVLDKVQHWPVFTNISEIFILVPALLGLKGNLEMTLASRLSTHANLGHMDLRKELWKMIVGNIALTQAQAIVVGFLASLAAMTFAWIPQGKFDWRHGVLLAASSVSTAALASLVLGSVMICVVVLSRKCHINPDNVATPIAASLGDLTTLVVLSQISHWFYITMGLPSVIWLAPVVLLVLLLMVPLWAYISHYNQYVHDVLYTGWTPVIGAMIISSIGGLILDFTVGNFIGLAVFQPVINGVGGNLVAVQASRLSTSLHMRSSPGKLPEDAIRGCPNPCRVFCNRADLGPLVLWLLVIPGQILFIYIIYLLDAGHTSITPLFCLFYLLASMSQVGVLLYISVWLVHWLWKRGNDPDNFSIPYLTALGDLLGTGLLALAFYVLHAIGDQDLVRSTVATLTTAGGTTTEDILSTVTPT